MKYCLIFICIILVQTTQAQAFQAKCTALYGNGLLPKLYTCDSSAIAPPIAWSNLPTGTKSIAITMHHIPKDGDKHVYMVCYNIAPNNMLFTAADKQQATWGSNTQNKQLAYSAPCSKGPGLKTYIITVYALSQPLHFNQSAVTMDTFLETSKQYVLASSQIPVQYARQ